MNPETFGTTEQGKTFKEHIINVAAECTLSRDSVDANISGRCVFNLMQFVNQLPTIHASENVALATVGQFLGQVVAGLHDSKTANLEKLNASQRRAVEAVEACLMHLKDNDLPPGYHGPRTALYRKLFGTEEGRKAQATTCRELGSRLAKQASESELPKDVEELCRDAYAALYAVDSSVHNSADFKNALRRVLCTSVQLQRAGFPEYPLDEIIHMSLKACVVTHVGGEAHLFRATRNFVDRLFSISRSRSEKAFVAAFGDDDELQRTAKYLAQRFDVKVVTPEEQTDQAVEPGFRKGHCQKHPTSRRMHFLRKRNLRRLAKRSRLPDGDWRFLE